MNQQISQQQRQLEKLLQTGLQALSRGDLRAAGQCCQQALKIKPDLVQAHFLVGLVALEGKDRKTAFQAFASVTRLEPGHSAAWAHLAKLFMSEGQVNKADKALQSALRSESSDPMVHDLLGVTWSLMGEHGLALERFKHANQLRPNHPPFMLNLANNLVYHGNNEQAEPLFRKIIALQANSPQAHWALSTSNRASNREHIEQMAALAQQRGQPPRAQAFYWYAMGKELEDLQDWDAAFQAFHRGASARRSTVEFDEAAEVEMYNYITGNFTREWFDSVPEAPANPSPIFVLGQPRTGTTLVERIISSHSQVHSAGELQQFSLAIRRIGNYQDPRRFSQAFFAAAKTMDPEKIGALYMQTTDRMRGSTPRFVDKLPQNFLLIPMILKALPGARIVHLTRDPMDACFASYKQLFADAYLHSYDQAEMARHHARYRKLMATWRERFPGQFHDISYEDTARNLEPNARALLDYLDLPWEDACLDFHRQDGAVSTASAAQVREPAHTRSIGRWRRYEKQLAPMLAELQRQGCAEDIAPV
jgi:tetratricopeptide (TPR) repeat protein